jgi:hypothetical protein
MIEPATSGDRVTGRRRRPGSGAPPIWFGIPFVLLGAFACVVSLLAAGNELRLSSDGVTVTGHVTQTRISLGAGDDSDTYYVEYAFVDDTTSLEYVDSTTVGERTFATVRVGDPITVSYLPGDPKNNRPGTTELNLLPQLLVAGVGALFAAVGAGVIVMGVRARRRASVPATASTTGTPLTGLVAAIPEPTGRTSAELGRVDRFSRSFGRAVLEPLFVPILGLTFLGLAAWMLMNIASNPMFLVLFALPAFFGVLLLSGIPGALRRGFGRVMLEVGPDGLWHRDAGRFAWPEIAQIRIEHNLGAAGEAGTTTYLRLGIVPRDPARSAGLSRSLSWRLTRAFIRFGNAAARWRGVRQQLTDLDAMAPLGIQAYEIEQPFEEVIASVGRFVPVADLVGAPEPAGESGPASTVTAPLSETDIREIDAHLSQAGSMAAPERLAPSLVEPPLVAAERPPEPAPANRPQVFRRRGFSAPDALGMVMGGGGVLPPAASVIGRAAFGAVFMVVPPLILLSIVAPALSRGDLVSALMPLVMGAVFVASGWFSMRGTRRRWQLATGDADLLTVGPEGIELRDGRKLPWDQVELVASTGGRLVIRPAGSARNDLITLDFDLFEDDDDDILDAIARYRVVEET